MDLLSRLLSRTEFIRCEDHRTSSCSVHRPAINPADFINSVRLWRFDFADCFREDWNWCCQYGSTGDDAAADARSKERFMNIQVDLSSVESRGRTIIVAIPGGLNCLWIKQILLRRRGLSRGGQRNAILNARLARLRYRIRYNRFTCG